MGESRRRKILGITEPNAPQEKKMTRAELDRIVQRTVVSTMGSFMTEFQYRECVKRSVDHVGSANKSRK